MRILFKDVNTYKSRSAIFLDRDGVINRRCVGGYVGRWQNFEFLPGVLNALKTLSYLQLPIIVVSNQACVAKGIVSEADLRDLTSAFQSAVQGYGGRIDAVYYCLHHPGEQCDCRKPRPGLLQQAAVDWSLSLSECFMIGDASSDVRAGLEAGCRTVLVNGSPDLQSDLPKRRFDVIDNLLAFAQSAQSGAVTSMPPHFHRPIVDAAFRLGALVHAGTSTE